MRKQWTPTAEGMGKSPYTKLIETVGGARIYSHTHPRIAGTHVIVWPPATDGRKRTDWDSYQNLEDAQSAANVEYYRNSGLARIGT